MVTIKSLGTMAAAAGLALSAPAYAANIVLNNIDRPGVGFNDPTPAAPTGGNPGATVGAQRLIAYGKALELWGKTLKSNVTIVVRGSFERLSCDAATGVLGQAGANQIFSDFAGAPLAGHWYPVALANALAGIDLAPGPLDATTNGENDDIVAYFNGAIGQADCLAGSGWYYGLDNNPPTGQLDFLDTFMHEVAHGLGFSNFANVATGSTLLGMPDVYMANTRDLTFGRQWNTLSAAEIQVSSINTGNVVWTGPNVTISSQLVLGPYQGVRVFGNLNREVMFGTASFGPAPSVSNFGGTVVLAGDGVAAPGGGTPTDGCEPITAPLVGKVALIDRGFCNFTVKVKNAQNAGAKAVMIANTFGRPGFDLGGTDGTITIPTIGISNADGDAIKAQLPTVSAVYFLDTTRRAGANDGYVRLYAPAVVALGSSISHFDTAATPNLLMEPFINTDLRASRNLDLTPALMQDIGWKIETLKIGSCDTGVPTILPTGQMLHAAVAACQAGAKNAGQLTGCVSQAANDAKKNGYLNGWQYGAIINCTGG